VSSLREISDDQKIGEHFHAKKLVGARISKPAGRLQKKRMRETFGRKDYVAFADRCEPKDKLHMSGTLDR
jgi:hypothetical protein